MTSKNHNDTHNSPVSSLEDLDWQNDEEDNFDWRSLGLEDYLSCALFLTLALILLAQVVSRYLLNAPLGWTEETARYQLILLTFLGASIGFRKNSHISFVYFHRFIPSAFKPINDLILSFINTLVLGFLTVSAVAIIPKLETHQMSSAAVPISVLYGLIGCALFISVIRSFIYTLGLLKNSRSDTSKAKKEVDV